MNYNIIPTREFEEDFKKLDKNFQFQIKNKFEKVAENPIRYKHLHYAFAGKCRIRVGKLRVIFSYNIDKKELYLEQIVFGHHY